MRNTPPAPERTAWHGARGLRLASPELSVVVLPEHGAKIASLLHRPTAREWLAQPAGDLPDPVYGASFVDAEMCGWDEMLPTIDACASPDTGAALPDHGEVWAMPWRVERAAPGELATVVHGLALPYRLRRTLTLDGNVLRLAYELSTTTTLSLLWAAHPQFACRPGTAVHLDAAWSPAVVSDLPRGTSHKMFVPPDVRVQSAELRDPSGESLHLTWDVPYVGVWLDHAEYAHEPVAAIEPTTGFYDELERAARLGCVSRVEPGRPLTWTLEVTAGRAAAAAA